MPARTAQRIPQEPTVLGAIWQLMRAISALAVIWWQISPVIVAGAALAIVERDARAAPLASIGAVTANTALAFAWPRWAALLGTSARRTAAWWWRHMRWQKLAPRVGLAIGTEPAVEVPRLLDIERHGPPLGRPQAWRFTFWPLGAHSSGKHDEIAEAIARELHSANGETRRHDDGRLTVTVNRHPIPAIAPGPEPQLRAGTPLPGLVPLATSLNGQLGWRIDHPACPHMMVVAATGGGKGATISQVTYRLLAQGWRVMNLNCKNSPELDDADSIITEVTTDAGVVAALRLASAELRARQADLKQASQAERRAGRPALRDYLAFRDRFGRRLATPMLIVVDEAATVATIDGVMDDLLLLAQMARSVDIHLLLATQHAPAEIFGRSGGTMLKANFGARVQGPSAEDSSFAMMLSGYTKDQRRRLAYSPRPGHALIQGLDPLAPSARPTEVQIYWNEPEELAATVVPFYEANYPDLAASAMTEAEIIAAMMDDDE